MYLFALVCSSYIYPVVRFSRSGNGIGPVLRHTHTHMAEILLYLFIINGMIVIIKLYKALYKPV
jgi:hypothetical protein